jgi:hypothetical protein
MAPVLEGKSIGSDQKGAKRRAPDLENQELAKDQGTVQLKGSICFKSVQIGS